MTPSAQHTPTPWTYPDGTGCLIGGPDRLRIADLYSAERSPEERQANAALIVRAVNAHDTLREALEDAEFLMRKLTIHPGDIGSMVDSLKRSAEAARAALKLAEGGKE